jgi:MtN3 and saliva related transmembrane protein
MSVDQLGYIAGLLVVLSLLPQFIKAWRTKLTRDISLLRYIIYIIGLILWIVYAILIKVWPVGIMNGVGLILALGILYLKIRYINGPPKD